MISDSLFSDHNMTDGEFDCDFVLYSPESLIKYKVLSSFNFF